MKKSRDPRVAVADMIFYGKRAVEITAGKDLPDLQQDDVLRFALHRILFVIGEAANRLPEELQARYPQIPWPRIVGLRNRLVHEYETIDDGALLAIAQIDLPETLTALRGIAAEIGVDYDNTHI